MATKSLMSQTALRCLPRRRAHVARWPTKSLSSGCSSIQRSRTPHRDLRLSEGSPSISADVLALGRPRISSKISCLALEQIGEDEVLLGLLAGLIHLSPPRFFPCYRRPPHVCFRRQWPLETERRRPSYGTFAQNMGVKVIRVDAEMLFNSRAKRSEAKRKIIGRLRRNLRARVDQAAECKVAGPRNDLQM